LPLRCGIIGLPNAGKSTIFNALSRAGAETAPYPFTTIKPNHGIATVPDERLEALAQLLRPPEVVPATVEFVDIAGLVKGAASGEGLGNQFLGHVREVDALAHVLRLFGGQVSHPYGGIDPVRDAGIVNAELALADLQVLERRVEKLGRQVKLGGKETAGELADAKRLLDAVSRGDHLKDDPAAREMLTAKPQLLVANVDEKELSERRFLPVLEEKAREMGSPLVVMCGDLEAEMEALEPAERAELIRSLGMTEPGLNALIRESYGLLGLVTFYTVVGAQMRAWAVRKGTLAPSAAGVIHTDMERGFIRAEVVHARDLLRAGSMAHAKEQGLVRLEGKDYALEDGDVVTFRFKV